MQNISDRSSSSKNSLPFQSSPHHQDPKARSFSNSIEIQDVLCKSTTIQNIATTMQRQYQEDLLTLVAEKRNCKFRYKGLKIWERYGNGIVTIIVRSCVATLVEQRCALGSCPSSNKVVERRRRG